jgi:hypothetical protein
MPPAAPLTVEAVVSVQAFPVVACTCTTPSAAAGAEQGPGQARAFVETAQRPVPALLATWVADGLRSTQAQVETRWLPEPRSCLPKGAPMR